MKWNKTGKVVTFEGTTILYEAEGTDIAIESRRRHIPHAQRGGTWDHTTYFVLRGNKELAKKLTLRAAMEYAEGLPGK